MSQFTADPAGGASWRAWRRTSEHTASLTAANPGGMTLAGTNTYAIADPDAAPGTDRPRAVVVDPGPEDREHAERIARAWEVGLILLTHRHADHTGGVAALRELTGAPVRAWDAALCVDAEPLADGETIEAPGTRVRVLHAPGHTSDSVCLHVPADDVLLTGDTILGEGTTMLDYPDGTLGDYLDTLRELEELPAATTVLPAHGEPGGSLREACEFLLDHRLTRIHQLRTGLRAAEDDLGPSASAVADRMYAGVPPEVRASAVKTLKAQLAYLVDVGEIAGFTE